jgi:2-desacetyl-2-hydroxyethyl bacteriochlorophyllide A dehydrogenase
MEAKQVVFTAPNKVELKAFDFDAATLAPREVAIKTHYSLISPGTECARLSGIEPTATFPFTPGYAACGEVLGVGKDIRHLKPGDRVFSYTPHASHVKTARLIAPLPAGIEEKLAPFARMASVSITALRVSEAALGDHVAVLGLGLVGNFAAQLFTLAGCEVIGIDVSPKRIELAQRCGMKHFVNSAKQDAKAAVKMITAGRMCEVVVEATGVPAVAETAAQYAGKLGEVVLVGSPRGAHMGNVTDLLSCVHLWGNGCVTLKGAHEWRYPVDRDPNGHVKHSIARNVEILLRLIAEGRLKVKELLTHLLPPSDCAAAYAGLREKKDEYLGVVFDWAKV